MKKRTSKVTIEIYDEDGVLAESIGGAYSHDEIKDQMIDILKNDGIPVIRRLGKHEAAEEKPAHAGHPAILDWQQPMTISIKYDGAEFFATGKYDDVMDAQAEFLRTILEE